MIQLDFVAVPPDSTGKHIHNVRHDVGGDQRYQQVVGLGDPEDPNLVANIRTGTPATNAAGAVVRQVPANYDSGLQTLPAALAAVTAILTRVHLLFLTNLTQQVQKVTVTNGAGLELLKDHPLPANGVLPLELRGMQCAGGIQWMAENAASVNGQIVGEQ